MSEGKQSIEQRAGSALTIWRQPIDQTQIKHSAIAAEQSSEEAELQTESIIDNDSLMVAAKELREFRTDWRDSDDV